MRLVPARPRTRRRIAWGAGALLVAAAIVAAVTLLPTRNPAIAEESQPSALPARIVGTPQTVALRPAERDAIDVTLAAFVRTAVRRSDVGAAYDLATPALRAGLSRSEWNHGGIPVMPYPAQIPGRRAWTLNYSYRNDVGLDLLLQPRPGAKTGAISFRTEVKKLGGRWRVEAFYPVATFSRPQDQARVQAEPDLAPRQEGSATKGRLSPLWLLVPGLGAVALVLLTPVVLLVVSWRRRVRAERAYQEFVEASAGRART